LAEVPLRAPLALAPATELVEGDWSIHVADGVGAVEYPEPVAREAIAELDVFAAEVEVLVEDPVLCEEQTLAGGAAAPEVGEVEHLAGSEVGVGEEEVADFGDVAHERGHLERGRPGGVAEDGNLLLGVLAMHLEVDPQEVGVGDVIIVEEEDDGR